MRWETPTFEEIDMNAEIGGYQGDSDDRGGGAPPRAAGTTSDAEASPVLQPDQVGAVEQGVARAADEPASQRSPLPAVALVLGGLVLMAAMPPAQRVHVYYHRPPGSYWR